MKTTCGIVALLAAVGGAGIGLAFGAPADKVQLEDVILGHLAAIGTPPARAAVSSRLAHGKVQMHLVQGGQGELKGEAFLLGEGKKYRVAMPFSYADYWGEQLLFDGAKTTLGFSQAATRSSLGSFLDRYDGSLKEGLIGGVLCPQWPLLDRESRQPKLSYGGLKKVDGRDLHAVTYKMKKGQGDEAINLFFDPEFHHVKSTYEVVVPSQMVNHANDSAKQVEGRLTLEEMFSDFAQVDGLTLPTHWTIRTNAFGDRARIREWIVVFDGIAHNRSIPKPGRSPRRSRARSWHRTRSDIERRFHPC